MSEKERSEKEKEKCRDQESDCRQWKYEEKKTEAVKLIECLRKNER